MNSVVRKTISLNDSNWRVGSVPQKPFSDINDLAEVQAWLPATVPGDVRLDLLRAGKISDPFFGTNNQDSQWIDSRDWWYVRELDLQLEKDERAFLIFDGIDYQSAIYLNGMQLGRHVGMFSQQAYELDSTISTPHSVLAVRVWGSDALPKLKLSLWHKLYARLIAPLFTPPNVPFPDRYATLKCQMQFGWDFAPRLRTSGIWDEAQIVIARSVFIQDVRIEAILISNSQTARIQVTLELDSDREQAIRAICTVKGKDFSNEPQTFEFDLTLQRGNQTRQLEFELQSTREWNPWDRGEPNLYELHVVMAMSPGGATKQSPCDYLTATFGIRSFQLEQRGAQKDPWTFILNGKREFIRGANWVPLDAIPGRLTRADYAARLNQAREANVNFLRVWGGGLREKRPFYDLCDEMGILVWQEFPFAGAILDRFPRNPSFVEFVRNEGNAIVRTLRNHPSLVVWCGGNEFNTRGNRAIVETLQEVVAQEDGTRPFKPASPYRDESHNWRVWHRFANVRDYKKDHTPFLSEFGLQSAPNIESLEKFLPPDATKEIWEYHHAELKKLKRYAQPHPNPPLSKGRAGEGFIIATQRAQAHAYQIAIEHLRRGKARSAAGVAIWQLNDAWPAISWSVIDYYGVPKLAYGSLQRAYLPVLASFDYALEPRRAGQIVHGDLWIINDLRSSFHNAQFSATLNGTEIFSQRVNIEPDSAIRILDLNAPLAEGENNLQLKLTWGPAPLCLNEYDLNFCDIGEINPLIALYVTLGNRLMR